MTYKSSKSNFSAGNEFDSLQLPEPRHATLYQPLPPSFSPVVAVSSTSLHSITIITIPPYQFGKDRYCLSFDHASGRYHDLFVLVAQCKCHVDPEQESEYEPHYQSSHNLYLYGYSNTPSDPSTSQLRPRRPCLHIFWWYIH